MKAQLTVLVGALVFAASGCNKLVDKTTDTPTNKPAQEPYVKTPDSELRPVDRAAKTPATTYCQPNADGSYPFETQMYGGDTSDSANGRYFFGEGGGCIDRPIRDVWATAMNQDLMVWTEKGNSGSYAMPPPPTGVSRFFDVEYVHVDTGITVKWYMTWFHSVLAGTPQKPDRILINYRRYKGTKFIKYWEGSIILTRLSETVTSIWIRNQINATRVNEVNARGGATDIIAKLRTGAPATDMLP